MHLEEKAQEWMNSQQNARSILQFVHKYFKQLNRDKSSVITIICNLYPANLYSMLWYCAVVSDGSRRCY